MDHLLLVNKIPLAGDQMPLLMLSAQFEGSSIKEIADILKRDKAGVFRGLRSFEKRGLIHFRGDLSDKRKRLVYLTPKGQEIFGTIISKLKILEKQIENHITVPELKTFYSVLDKINANCLESMGKKRTDLEDFGFKNPTGKKLQES